jgi:hypothetical protein
MPAVTNTRGRSSPAQNAEDAGPSRQMTSPTPLRRAAVTSGWGLGSRASAATARAAPTASQMARTIQAATASAATTSTATPRQPATVICPQIARPGCHASRATTSAPRRASGAGRPASGLIVPPVPPGACAAGG